jgi:hypothetical protein
MSEFHYIYLFYNFSISTCVCPTSFTQIIAWPLSSRVKLLERECVIRQVVSSGSASYWCSKSRHGHRVSSSFFFILLCHSSIKLGHDRFLTCLFQFIIRYIRHYANVRRYIEYPAKLVPNCRMLLYESFWVRGAVLSYVRLIISRCMATRIWSVYDALLCLFLWTTFAFTPTVRHTPRSYCTVFVNTTHFS